MDILISVHLAILKQFFHFHIYIRSSHQIRQPDINI
jgi:hypothetical protein